MARSDIEELGEGDQTGTAGAQVGLKCGLVPDFLMAALILLRFLFPLTSPLPTSSSGLGALPPVVQLWFISPNLAFLIV